MFADPKSRSRTFERKGYQADLGRVTGAASVINWDVTPWIISPGQCLSFTDREIGRSLGLALRQYPVSCKIWDVKWAGSPRR